MDKSSPTTNQLIFELRGYLNVTIALLLLGSLFQPLLIGYPSRRDRPVEFIHLAEVLYNPTTEYLRATDPEPNWFFWATAMLAFFLPLVLLLTPQDVSPPPRQSGSKKWVNFTLGLQASCLVLLWFYTWTLTWNTEENLRLGSWGAGMFCLSLAHVLTFFRTVSLNRIQRLAEDY
ncbi:hypothetical protein [Buchananella hordeovulneris]|uniref:hypothetical protein n=1 Tax=Buchananella hordeovulneris TaxID=52770 RepID=UPI000F5EB576|nr:hypothetical protein [Buchananella hordeovulneris]RRD45068.1 hypothetical protein EII13_02665 [Buchananella hordeovulneris]